MSRGAASASDRRSSSVCTFSTGWLRIDRVDGVAQHVAERRRIAGRAHEDLPGNPERRLRQRHVELRDRLLRQAELPDVADHADDGEPVRGAAHSAGRPALICDPTGSVPSQYFVIALLITTTRIDSSVSRSLKTRPLTTRNADRARSIAARDADVRWSAAAPGSSMTRPSMSKRVVPGAPPPSGTALVIAAGAHARLRLQPLEHRQIQLAQRVDVGIAREVAEDLRRQHAVRSITGLDTLQAVEAREQQSRADQQHHRHRHLRDDQRALHPLAAPASPAWPPPCFSADDQIDAAAERRQRAEQHAGHDRDAKREDQHRSDRSRSRRCATVKRPTNVVSMSIVSHANADADDAAGDRQQRALGQQLPHQPAAAGAERGAHRQLAIAAEHPRQREVGDVRARDQQHQAGDAEQDQQQLRARRWSAPRAREPSWRGSPTSRADRPACRRCPA